MYIGCYSMDFSYRCVRYFYYCDKILSRIFYNVKIKCLVLSGGLTNWSVNYHKLSLAFLY